MILPTVQASRALALEARRGNRLRVPARRTAVEGEYEVLVSALKGYRVVVRPVGTSGLGVKVQARNPNKAARLWSEADWLMRDIFGGSHG